MTLLDPARPDHVGDAGKMVAVHSAVVIYAYHNQEWNNTWIWIPLLFQLTATCSSPGWSSSSCCAECPPPTTARNQRPLRSPPSTIKALGSLLADYGVLCLSFLLIGVPVLFGAAYTTLFILNAAICVLFLRKWFKTLRTL